MVMIVFVKIRKKKSFAQKKAIDYFKIEV